jgi:hypothetical protein
VDVLFVTAYPPPFDERSRAAVDHVRALRSEGHRVEVLSPTPSAAHHHRALDSWWALGSVAALLRRFDRVDVDEELVAIAPLRAALRTARSVQRWQAPSVAPSPPVVPEVAWPSERDAAMAEIRARAAGSAASPGGTGDPARRLRQVRALTLPEAGSARPGASVAKRAVRRLTRWQLDPIVETVNQLRSAVIDAFEALERRGG